MKTSTILAAVGVFALGKIAFDALLSTAFNKFQLSYGKPVIDTSGLLSGTPTLRVSLPVTIQNNNSVGATVQSFSGELFYGPTKLSNVMVPAPAQIPANGTGQVTLQFDIVATQVIQDIIANITTLGTYGTLVNTLRIKGRLETNIIAVPVDQNIALV